MGLRIEYIIVVFLMVVSSSLVLLQTHSVHPIESNASKELLFQNFSLIELGENGIAQQLSASLAIKDKRYFELDDINVTYQKTQHLLAKKARYEEKFIYLTDHVRLSRDDGVRFETKALTYSLVKGSISSHKPFVLEMNESRIAGDNLHYNLKSKRVWADNIEAKIIVE